MGVTTLPHTDGATEPYITEVVCALIKANDARRVLETGGFLGHTSVRLAETLRDLGGERELAVAEIDMERAQTIDAVLAEAVKWSIKWSVFAQDVMQVIALQPDESLDAVWIDDDHQPQHVYDEIAVLLPKMRRNGLLLLHDVFGVCDLQAVVAQFGGYSLDLPRWGPAGGLGILQCR